MTCSPKRQCAAREEPSGIRFISLSSLSHRLRISPRLSVVTSFLSRERQADSCFQELLGALLVGEAFTRFAGDSSCLACSAAPHRRPIQLRLSALPNIRHHSLLRGFLLILLLTAGSQRRPLSYGYALLARCCSCCPLLVWGDRNLSGCNGIGELAFRGSAALD